MKNSLPQLLLLTLSCSSFALYGDCESCTLRSASHQDDLNASGYYEDSPYFNSNLRASSRQVALAEEISAPSPTSTETKEETPPPKPIEEKKEFKKNRKHRERERSKEAAKKAAAEKKSEAQSSSP